MASPLHFLPRGASRHNPVLTGTVAVTGGSIQVGGIPVIAPDGGGSFPTLAVAGADYVAGPLIPGPYVGDAEAAAAGVVVGQAYIQATTNLLRVRMN